VLSIASLVALASLVPLARSPESRPASRPAPRAQQGRPAPAMQIPADVEPVVTTKSGLKYSVLAKGAEGASPKFGDR
jgi:hypothetical protein